MAVFGVFLFSVSTVPSLPFFLGGFLIGVFFGVTSPSTSTLVPFIPCFCGVVGSGVESEIGATIFCRLLEVGSNGLLDPVVERLVF